jgi:uncharacterized membrane protein YidH (DUF202 family)
MGSAGGAGSTDRTRGLYMYSISPFYQRTFRGYSRELAHVVKSHFGWAIFATGITLGGYGIVKWANHDFHRRGLKNPKDYENEVIAEN